MTNSSSASGAGHILGSRYATSLIEAAQQAGVLPFVEKDMVSLRRILDESSEFRSLIGHPVYAEAQKMNAVKAVGQRAGFYGLTVNFLCVLVQNGRSDALPVMIDAFFREVERRRGIVEAKVVSAFPLTDLQQKTLAETLSAKTGKTVRLNLSLDQSLLGGMVVTVGSQMIDDSLKTRLDRLKQMMIGTKAA